MSAPLRLADLLAGLSLVTDLGMGHPPDEAMRATLIATALARRMDLPEPQVADVFYTALLQHVGCTAHAHESAQAFGNEIALNAAGSKTNFANPPDIFATLLPELTKEMGWTGRVRTYAFATTRGNRFGNENNTAICEVARDIARRVGLSEMVQRSLHEVFEWWNGKGNPQGLRGDAIALPARVTRVATFAALFSAIGDEALALDAVRKRSGGFLDPSIAALFDAAGDDLLREIAAADPKDSLLAAEPKPHLTVPEARLPDVARAFADMADLKTPFTHGHSSEVANIAKEAGEKIHLDRSALGRLHVSALLHDLGRVGISNSIWEHPGPLTGAQWEQVRLHPYHSERILARAEALQPMAQIAGMHHERVDGSGYHRGCKGREIAVPARILAAADAYQAMTQKRPHRDALSDEEASERLAGEGRAGRLNGDAVRAVLDVAGLARPNPARAVRPAGLSEREIEVLRLMAAGHSNKDIARQLYVSPRTAEHHVQHVYAKIGVSSRAAAALFAMEHQLLV